MEIKTCIFSKKDAKENILFLLEKEFFIGPGISKEVYDENILPHFDTLSDDVYFLAETKYVDKVYRDTYYKYYASKFDNPTRYCLRLSLFNSEIKDSDFDFKIGREELVRKYKGFYVLRPTNPYIIGRSIVSPDILKNNNFTCCISEFSSTAKGLKFNVAGFPHMSQDHEAMTCAETTLWAIMAYFSNKYPEYNGVLPSRIIDVQNEISIERQLPSKGLDINQMSYSLKKFGFGSRIYSKDFFGEEFKRLLSCYVESGIPLIIAMGNNKSGDDNIAHAVLAIGHQEVTPEHIDAIVPFRKEISDNAPKFNFYDYDDIEKEFIFVDDNCPAYQSASLSKPVCHYKSTKWQGCEIEYFIAPLYPKIYLEANEAKKYIIQLIISIPELFEEIYPCDSENEIIIRVFLASSCSYKDKLVQNDDFDEITKALIIEASMPKFIWVAEISTKKLIKQQKAEGLILLDATEANLEYQKPLIFAFIKKNMFKFDKNVGKLRLNSLPLKPFTIYRRSVRA